MTACTAPYSPENEREQLPDSHLSRLLKPLPGFSLCDSSIQPAYREACDYVAKCFKRQYGAKLTHFMPWLMTMHCLGGVSGVVGIRPASRAGDAVPLFLEQYLDAPVEEFLPAGKDPAVSRDRIAEIGNLVASQCGASQLVFLLMTTMLLDAGYEWVVFTATRTLRNTLARLDFPVEILGSARLDSLPTEEQASWGSYYNTDPMVVAGRLDAVRDLIAKRPLLRQALRVYEGAVQHMADTFIQC